MLNFESKLSAACNFIYDFYSFCIFYPVVHYFTSGLRNLGFALLKLAICCLAVYGSQDLFQKYVATVQIKPMKVKSCCLF